jgi:hypothetical protein
MILTAQTPGKDGTADRKLYLQWRGKLVEKVDVSGKGLEIIVKHVSHATND